MTTDLNHIFIYKTDIRTDTDRAAVAEVLEENTEIQRWSVDLHDADCVLRIISPTLTNDAIIELVTNQGYECIELQ